MSKAHGQPTVPAGAPLGPGGPAANAPITVNPIWILKALALSLLGAGLCAYLALCLLFYQGQWQLVLHPPATATPPQCDSIEPGPASSGTIALKGCQFPAPADARYATYTLLYLRDGDDAMAASVPVLASLRDAGLNVVAPDYRGFTQGDGLHPTQHSMTEDAVRALDYVTSTSHVDSAHIILYGSGVGASLAVALAATHPAIPAVILEQPRGDLLQTALADPRTRLLPVRLLFHERFPLAAPLSSLATPKLLLSFSPSTQETRDPAATAGISSAIRTAASPRITVESPAAEASTVRTQSLRRFLDQYLAPGGVAMPSSRSADHAGGR